MSYELEVAHEIGKRDREIELLREQVEKLKAELASIDGALNDHRANLTLTTSEIIWELKGQVEKLTKERDELVNAIDNEMVVTHMGVFNAGDDPKVALNKICCYAQDLGKFFAEDACKGQLAALAEQNEKFRKLLPYCNTGHYGYSIQQMYFEAAQLPDLASPILNRIRAEGMKKAADYCTKNTSASAHSLAVRLRDQAAELEKSNG